MGVSESRVTFFGSMIMRETYFSLNVSRPSSAEAMFGQWSLRCENVVGAASASLTAVVTSDLLP